MPGPPEQQAGPSPGGSTGQNLAYIPDFPPNGGAEGGVHHRLRSPEFLGFARGQWNTLFHLTEPSCMEYNRSQVSRRYQASVKVSVSS